MLRLLSLLALFLIACDPTTPITPEPRPDSGAGGASASSSTSQGAGASGGGGGTGGALSCDPCTNTDGTRIVHRRTTTTTLDGYKRVVDAGMFDALRNETCAPTIAADGVLRCLPVATPFIAVYYADIACSVPLFPVPVGPCVNAPAYVGEAVAIPGECAYRVRVLKFAGEHVGDVFIKAGAACTKVATPTQSLYLGGAEVTPGAFAIVEQETTP